MFNPIRQQGGSFIYFSYVFRESVVKEIDTTIVSGVRIAFVYRILVTKLYWYEKWLVSTEPCTGISLGNSRVTV